MDSLWIPAGIYVATGLFAFWKRAQLIGLFEQRGDPSTQKAAVISLFVLCIVLGPIAAVSILAAMFDSSHSDL